MMSKYRTLSMQKGQWSKLCFKNYAQITHKKIVYLGNVIQKYNDFCGT